MAKSSTGKDKENEKEKDKALYTCIRTSYFDICDYNAAFYKSDMKGFYIMYILISSTYVGISACSKFTNKGFSIESTFYYSMIKDIEFLICL